MPTPRDPEHPGRSYSSLAVGPALLAGFTAERPVRGIADMADVYDSARSTTHRYLSTLATLGYLEHAPSRKDRLSARASDVGLSLRGSMVLWRVAREHPQGMRRQTGWTVVLGVFQGDEVVCIDRWHGSRTGQYTVDEGVGVGARSPVQCSAMGKAILTCLPEIEQRKLIVEVCLTHHAPKTITSKMALGAEVQRTAAEDGIEVKSEELVTGRRARAAVVADDEGRPVAAIDRDFARSIVKVDYFGQVTVAHNLADMRALRSQLELRPGRHIGMRVARSDSGDQRE